MLAKFLCEVTSQLVKFSGGGKAKRPTKASIASGASLRPRVKVLEAGAASNLEKTLDGHTEDEIDTMARALNTASHAMRRTMG